MAPHIEAGQLQGIVDINKPEHEPAHGWRCEYANRHNQVLSANDVVMEMEHILDEERRSIKDKVNVALQTVLERP